MYLTSVYQVVVFFSEYRVVLPDWLIIDWFLAFWLADIQQSRKNRTLYLPVSDLRCQYNVWFF